MGDGEEGKDEGKVRVMRRGTVDDGLEKRSGKWEFCGGR